jgi:uncharacterized protein YbjT (DUF2867 family)
VSLLGPGTQRISPIFLDDVVEAIVHAALDPASPTGTFTLTGPDTFTLNEFARHLNRPEQVRLRHLSPWVARLLGRTVPSLPAPLVDVMLHDAAAPAEAGDTAATFGLRLRDEVWTEEAVQATSRAPR